MSKVLPHTQPFGMVAGVRNSPPQFWHFDRVGLDRTFVLRQFGQITVATVAATPAAVAIKNPLAGADVLRLRHRSLRSGTR
jgi:hypothetical protein